MGQLAPQLSKSPWCGEPGGGGWQRPFLVERDLEGTLTRCTLIDPGLNKALKPLRGQLGKCAHGLRTDALGEWLILLVE